MKGKSGGKTGLRILLISLLLLIGGFTWLVRFAYRAPVEGRQLGLDQVYSFSAAGQVVSARLLDEDAQLIGKICPVPGGGGPSVQPSAPAPAPAAGFTRTAPAARVTCPIKAQTVYSSYPRSDVSTQQLIERLAERGAAVQIDKQTDKAIAKVLILFVFPLAMLANLFGLIFVSKGGDSSMADIAGFGTLRKKRQRKQRISTGVTFADIAGVDEAVAELQEVTDYLTNPQKFEAYGAAAPKGVLLFGPPGVGKTLMARAVAGETGVAFFSISGTEFVESLVGVGAARVRDLFSQVREAAPAIVFIDEIDAVGRRRSGEGMSGGEREQTLNQLLVEMDGFEVTSAIVLMAATNRPDILDPALMRPGRFDRHITLEPPDINGRRQILELHAAGKPIGTDVDWEFFARRTPGFTGADLANVVNESALLSIREGGGEGSEVHTEHVSEAIQRVLHGPQRRGQLMSPEERKRLAFHESGHSVVAGAFGRTGDTHRISIVARGRGLGRTTVGSDEVERVLLTDADMLYSMATAMGGIAAELLVFGNTSTTAEDDVERTTSLAREMVGVYGMSEKMGRLHLLTRYDGYLGADAAAMESVGINTMEAFDGEVKRLVALAEHTASQILAHNQTLLAEMAQTLQQEETMEGSALERFVSRAKVPDGLLPVSISAAAGTNGTRIKRGSVDAAGPGQTK